LTIFAVVIGFGVGAAADGVSASLAFDGSSCPDQGCGANHNQVLV